MTAALTYTMVWLKGINPRSYIPQSKKCFGARDDWLAERLG